MPPKDPIKYEIWRKNQSLSHRGERLSETQFYRLMKNDSQNIPLKNFRAFIRRFDLKPPNPELVKKTTEWQKDPIKKARAYEKISKALKGVKKTPEHNKNVSEGLKKLYSTEEGKKYAKERGQKLRGRVYSQETIEKMRVAKIGKTYSAEVNAKKGRKGRVSNRKGCINPESRIRKFFERLEQRYTRKQQRSDNHKGSRNSMYGKKRPEISLLMSELAPTRKFPFTNSKPERMMQLSLKILDIPFVTHKVISSGKKFRHSVDIFIEPNICLEVDGKYFHTLPKNAKRDVIINHELIKAGYLVIRVWDTDILKDSFSCAKTILKLIKQCSIGVITL